MRAILLAATLLAPGFAFAQSAAPPPAPAATVVEQSPEYRFQIDFHVNEAALAKFLPAGWTANVAAAGAAKDCNLRVIFIDRTNVVAGDGKVIGDGTNRQVYLAVPVKNASGGTGQIIIAGLSEKADPADAFGVLTKATRANVSRSVSVKNGATLASEDWDFAAASGEQLRMRIQFTPAPANRGGGKTSFFNPKNPAQFQVFETTQATDIARNVTTTPPDRVKQFSFKGGGGALASLFDGTEKVLSWDSQRWYVRTISNPTP